MAGRSKYASQDKNSVFVVLSANDGNVKRTARETGLPETTVRSWRDEWRENGAPPAEELEVAVSDFVGSAERVRNLALQKIEEKLKGDVNKLKISEMNVTVGILTDKIDRAKGLDVQRVEHTHGLDPDQARDLVLSFLGAQRLLSERRDAEIVEAEIVEQPALPAGR